MPILSPIGRKHPRVRALIALIYLILIGGGLTMVYPFLLMMAGSTKSGVDVRDIDVVPAYLRQDDALYRKYIEGLFNESLELYRIAYDRDDRSFERIPYPVSINHTAVADWHTFVKQTDLPPYASILGFIHTRISRTTPHMLRDYKARMLAEFGRDVHAMNRRLGTDFVNWNAFFVTPENYYSRLRSFNPTPFQTRYLTFKDKQPESVRHYASLQGFYKNAYLKARFGQAIADYNAAHGTAHASYDAVRLPRRAPDGPAVLRETWEHFVRRTINLLWIRVDTQATAAYRAFLRAKYNDVAVFNKQYNAAYDSFADVDLAPAPPLQGVRVSDWDQFIQGWKDPDTGRLHAPPLETLRIEAPDFWFQDFLAERYGPIGNLNAAWQTDYASYAGIILPQRDVHAAAFLDARRALRWEFTTRNYKTVLDYLLFHGRGIMNTAIYCTLAVLLALLVNPMAAYAMSRYKMPSAYKILLFLLLTMAFPPIVTQIPVFLMLRDFNLLNTFAALVLPGMAHGYSIFLLKGFFDSLPRELYESAEIDGANEWTMFWHISMSLSKPILAVIALNAFTQAYSNFMFALLICQDERMWTLMVWLYQLQMRSGQGVIYASLIVAAIPTFLIFFFCQQIILRGIVVPVEK